MNPTLQQSIAPHQYTEEQVMVIKRQELFADHEVWQGMQSKNLPLYLERIKTLHTFLPRSRMETDPTYKQIIPYMLFTHENNYFLMQRQSKSGDQRLHNKFTLGIGGHVRIEDLQEQTLWGWAQREFEEEINYQGNLEISTLGILNDDSNAVGQVHIGLVLLLKGDSSTISVKEELKSGTLASLETCREHYDSLESWSQIALNFIQSL